jgi:hypothetical protein
MQLTLFIRDADATDFGYNVENMAVYNCDLLYMLGL